VDAFERAKMKVRYFIDKQRRLILTTAEGSIKFDDIKDHQDRLLADPDFEASFDELIDTSAVMKFDISANEAGVLAERRNVSPESRRAFVAPKSHIFGLARIMEVYHERVGHAQVFYSMDEAVKWLDRDKLSRS
jgi:hypothetical protein